MPNKPFVIHRTRIAPTPSGYLHEGNGFAFALTALLARQHNTALLLRVDDIDRGRFRQPYLQDIFETLTWMGIGWTEGPRDATDFLAYWSQHLHLARYTSLLEHLVSTGRVYACTCSRRDVRAASSDGRYPGTCREKGIELHRPGVAWRIRVPAETLVSFRKLGGSVSDTYRLAGRLGDFVIRGKNGLPAYQVVSVADDLHHGCDLIVRGADLLDSTLAQLYLAGLVGAERFAEARFLHHPLLTDAAGGKLSKSEGATALRQWRATGRSAAPLWDRAAAYLAEASLTAD